MRRAAAVLAVGLTLASCDRGSSVTLPVRPTVVKVRMHDYRFIHEPTAAPGRVVVEADNDDTGPHQLVLVRLPEDMTGTLADQLQSETRRAAQTIQQFAFAPDDRRAFAVDLPPGHYGFVCFVTEPDGTTHAAKGMASDLWVGRPPAASTSTPIASKGSHTGR